MKRGLKGVLLIAGPFLLGWVSLFVGAYGISPLLVLKILLDGFLKVFGLGDIPERAIVLDVRLPRVLLAFMVGGALSGSGTTLQALFRNPLVDPYILGISSGAAFGCALTIGFFPFVPVQGMAFVFAVVAVLLAYGIAKSQGEVSRLSLVLSGVIVSAFFTALVSIIKFLVDPHRLQAIVYWLMGSFSLADWDSVKKALPGILVGLTSLYLMRWRLNVLSMGEEEALALGVDVKRERILFLAFSTLAVASATSVCGIIGWVGLMVPHLVRMLVGSDHRTLLPLSISAGGGFLIAADTLSRTLTSFDIPVGIITALAGAPFFIYLFRRGKEAWGRA